MIASHLLDDLSARGVVLTLDGDSLAIDAPAGVLTDADMDALRSAKPGVMRMLRLASGLAVDDEAASVLAMDEVDANDIPICQSCGSHCDAESVIGTWRCSRCDPGAEARRHNTERWLRAAESIRSRGRRVTR